MIHILNSTHRLDKYENQIKSIIDTVFKQYKDIISVGPVDVVVAENASMTIPGHGIGGYATTAHELYIPLDLGMEDVSKVIDTHLASTIAHELAHIVRLQGGIAMSPAGTLADNVVAEGLADHLSVSLYPEQDIPWTSSLDKATFSKMKTRFLEEAHQPEYNHHAWFFGSEELELPHWTGYTLGYSIVKEYLEKNNENIKDNLLIPTKKVLTAWDNK